MYSRLATLMFLQYAVPGSWMPVYSLHLQSLDFTPTEIAWCCATMAIAGMVAPLFWGQVADRWLPAERCISVCSFFGAGLLWSLSTLTTPVAVFVASLAFWSFMVPTMSLGASIAFRHLEHPERQYGRVRLWGTAGWMGAGWFLGLLLFIRGADETDDLATAFRLASILCAALCIYALILPSSPPSPSLAQSTISWWRRFFDAPLQATQLFRHRSFTIYICCLFGAFMTMPFTLQMSPLLLAKLGFERRQIPPLLTLAQMVEVLSLWLLPILLLRLETRRTMLLGLAAWTAALTVFCVGSPRSLVIVCLGMQGIYISCFVVTGQMFVNRLAGKEYRASALALIQFFNGVGMLVGNLLVGYLRELSDNSFTITFGSAAITALCLLITLYLGFRLPSPTATIAPATPTTPTKEAQAHF